MLWVAVVLMMVSGWLGGTLALVTVGEDRYCEPSSLEPLPSDSSVADMLIDPRDEWQASDRRYLR